MISNHLQSKWCVCVFFFVLFLYNTFVNTYEIYIFLREIYEISMSIIARRINIQILCTLWKWTCIYVCIWLININNNVLSKYIWMEKWGIRETNVLCLKAIALKYTAQKLLFLHTMWRLFLFLLVLLLLAKVLEMRRNSFLIGLHFSFGWDKKKMCKLIVLLGQPNEPLKKCIFLPKY